MSQAAPNWLDQVAWNQDGLVPAIAQDADNGDVLMMAWMNRAALAETIAQGEVVYWSRSRAKLWHKGETSGNVQKLVELHLDCDNDAILLRVEQIGGVACHTGRRHCFFQKLITEPDNPQEQEQKHSWLTTGEILRDPAQMYGQSSQS